MTIFLLELVILAYLIGVLIIGLKAFDEHKNPKWYQVAFWFAYLILRRIRGGRNG